MVQHIPKALLLALLLGGCESITRYQQLGAPVMAEQKNDYRYWRDLFLGPWRSELMAVCSDGMQFNSRGFSYWDSAMTKSNTQNALVVRKVPPAQHYAYEAGKALAMNNACPDVR